MHISKARFCVEIKQIETMLRRPKSPPDAVQAAECFRKYLGSYKYFLPVVTLWHIHAAAGLRGAKVLPDYNHG
jgi:hypothetical protein